MIKNLTGNQVLLIALATVLLLLASVSFYLLQDSSSPFLYSSKPPTGTLSPVPPSSTATASPSPTNIPTRQTSYTPFAVPGSSTATMEITAEFSSTQIATLPPPATPSYTQTSGTPLPPSSSLTPSPTSTQAGDTTTPTGTPTLLAGEHLVTGRVVRNNTPVANVVVRFFDDVPPRQATTDSGGHYYFTTLAPGTRFNLEFYQAQNPQLTPVTDIASRAWIEGPLPTGVDVITFPDLEISVNLGGMIFELETPVDGAAYSAANIGPNNPIQFNWTLYNQGLGYQVELGALASGEPLWVSTEITATNLMWNGTLDDETHILQGNYWWRVRTSRLLGAYYFYANTPNNDLIFNP